MQQAEYSNWQEHTALVATERYKEIHNYSYQLRDDLLAISKDVYTAGLFEGFEVNRNLNEMINEAAKVYEITQIVNKIVEEDLGSCTEIQSKSQAIFTNLKSWAIQVNKEIEDNLERCRQIKDNLIAKNFLIAFANGANSIIYWLGKSTLKVIKFTVNNTVGLLLPRSSRKALFNNLLKSKNYKQIRGRRWYD